VWAFIGDGETDEPETLGAIRVASRAHLDNLIWVVNCNLQRLDGPVYGNGQIIQELEGIFRGSGWNVIKVAWGSAWDELLERDVDGAVVKRFEQLVDGESQRYAAFGGQELKERFFNTPELRELTKDYTDADFNRLNRGGHDPLKIYAAFEAAVKHTGQPTVILARTVKGYGLGAAGEAQNVAHQQKKLDENELKAFRDRFDLPVTDEQIQSNPYLRFDPDSAEAKYLLSRREELGGFQPFRHVTAEPLAAPDLELFEEFMEPSGDRAVSTTMLIVNMIRKLLRDPAWGKLIVPIIPDEARTFGMESLFRQVGIYSGVGQLYEPVDSANLLFYKESTDGQILEEGITEAGAMSSFIAAGTAYSTRGVPMIPFFTYYSMFGFQRVGDLIWQAADMRARGFLMGATAGRTTLLGEGLQHQDGHSMLLASTVPSLQAYDPAFAYEIGAIVKHGIERMYGQATDLDNGEPLDPDSIFYIALYNENYVMPALDDEGGTTAGFEEGAVRGLYRWQAAPDGPSKRATILFSGVSHGAARQAVTDLAEHYDVAAELWSATSYKRLREQALSTERWNRLHPSQPARTPLVTKLLGESQGPITAVSDWMKTVPEQIARFVPEGRRFDVLGTDGMGRSDTREALRRHFEIDAGHVVVSVLTGLFHDGYVEASVVDEAIARYGIDADAPDPRNA